MHVLISIYIPDLHKYEQKQFMYNMKCTKNDLLVSNLLMKNNLSILYVDDDILFVTDCGRPVRKLPSLHSQKSTPTTKFLGTTEAYFVCHISPNFQISLIGCPFDLCLHWVFVVRAFCMYLIDVGYNTLHWLKTKDFPAFWVALVARKSLLKTA